MLVNITGEYMDSSSKIEGEPECENVWVYKSTLKCGKNCKLKNVSIFAANVVLGDNVVLEDCSLAQGYVKEALGVDISSDVQLKHLQLSSVKIEGHGSITGVGTTLEKESFKLLAETKDDKACVILSGTHVELSGEVKMTQVHLNTKGGIAELHDGACLTGCRGSGRISVVNFKHITMMENSLMLLDGDSITLRDDVYIGKNSSFESTMVWSGSSLDTLHLGDNCKVTGHISSRLKTGDNCLLSDYSWYCIRDKRYRASVKMTRDKLAALDSVTIPDNTEMEGGTVVNRRNEETIWSEVG